VFPSVTSGTTNHSAGWVPVYAMGPNSGHVTGHLDNTSIPGIAITTAPEPAATVRKTFRLGENGYGGTRDAQLRADAPATPGGAASTLVVDLDDNTATGNQPAQAVIRFDDIIGALGIPAGSEIRSAKLTVHTGNVTNDDTSGTLAAHRLLVGFDDATTTWDNAGRVAGNGFSLNDAASALDDDYLATPESLFPAPTLNTLASFDVTASLIAWMADASSNHGWLLLSDSTNGWRWDSSESAGRFRPVLEVTYVPEPSACLVVAMVAGAALARRQRPRH